MVARTKSATRFRIPYTPYARREEVIFAAIPFVISLVLVAAWIAGGPGWLGGVGAGGALMAAAVSTFFRDPRRVPPPGEEKVVSPADGKVVAIRDVSVDGMASEEGVEVDIFLSIFDVHVNRSPIAGVVERIEHREGEYRSALREAAGSSNERNTLYLRGDRTWAVVRQISGAVARRIVCRCAEGDRLDRGQPFGMIKFGSRTQVVLPRSDFDPAVRPGDRVKGGTTVIGILRGAHPE